jgi:hypothetical protein
MFAALLLAIVKLGMGAETAETETVMSHEL